MKYKIILLFVLLILAFSLFFYDFNCRKQTEQNIKIVDNIIEQLVKENFQLIKNDKNAVFSWVYERERIEQWTYFNAFVMLSLLEKGKYDDFVNTFYDNNIFDDGMINGYKEFSVDSVMPGRNLFYLYNKYKYPKYKVAINNVYKSAENQPKLANLGDNYRQKYGRRWEIFPFGLDGLYMMMPFLMKYSKEFADEKQSKEIQNKIFNQMQWVFLNMKNSEGLYNHGCQEDGKTVNNVIWLRAVGWYAMAQVDVIELMSDKEQKKIMINNLQSFLDGMIKFCDKKQYMWYNIVNYKDDIKNNKFETSGSCMMAYTLLKAYNNGYLKNRKYAILGLKVFNSVVKNNIIKIDNNYKVQDIYTSSNVKSSPEKYCRDEKRYTQNEPKGLGALFLASTEAEKYIKNNILIP